MIKCIAHICFTVGDLDASAAFYKKLGFTHAYDYRRDNGELFGVMLHIGGRNFLELFKGQLNPAAEKQRYRHFCLECDDLRATVETLRAGGIEVTDIQTGSDRALQAWVNDPEGNRIELQEYRPESNQTPWVK
jgi:catechol 2,3-dioxygenase-like lactoylglutathione lyase family enzyme